MFWQWIFSLQALKNIILIKIIVSKNLKAKKIKTQKSEQSFKTKTSVVYKNINALYIKSLKKCILLNTIYKKKTKVLKRKKVWVLSEIL